MRTLNAWMSELGGNLRLAGIAVIGSLLAFPMIVRSLDGSWSARLRHALTLALTPVLMIWPHRSRTAQCASSDELARMRRLGAL